MDPILAKFQQIKWAYGDKDDNARQLLAERIARAGRKRSLLTYSDLVNGVSFRLPNVRENPKIIDVTDWAELDRAIVGSFLGYLALKSYEAAGFFSSALVVGKTESTPSEGFYNLLRELDLIASSKSDKAMRLWAQHVGLAHTWYAAYPEEVV